MRGADGDVVADARVELVGLSRSARSDASGAFVISGVPAGAHAIFATADKDNDGITDEGAIVTVLVPRDRRTKSAAGVDLGPVRLELTGTVEGNTIDEADLPIGAATVALWRTVTLTDAEGGSVSIDLAVERQVESQPDGSFRIEGLIAGDAFLAGFDSVAGVATRASVPATVRIPAGQTVEADASELNPVEGTRKARITFLEKNDDVVEITIVPTKTAPDEVTLTINGTDDVVIDVPFGIWDVYFTSGIKTAVLRGQVAPPPGPEVVSWGIVELIVGDDVCGDGVVSGLEQCDNGDDNSDTAADACRTTCVPASCGDGVVDGDEGCDDGDANSDTAADACRTTCVPAGCGDGVVDGDEGCDDGADNSNVGGG